MCICVCVYQKDGEREKRSRLSGYTAHTQNSVTIKKWEEKALRDAYLKYLNVVLLQECSTK